MSTLCVPAAGLVAAAVWVVAVGQADGRCRALLTSGRPRAGAGAGTGTHGSPMRQAALFDLVAAALDAGLAPMAALAAASTAWPAELRDVVRRMDAMAELGDDPAAVWRLLADDVTLGPLGEALLRADRSGAPVAASVRVLADEARRDERAERLERARRVGVRTAAPLGVCFLPSFLLVAVVPTVVGLVAQAW